MLLDLLEPAEALELGPDIYRQHRVRRSHKCFYRKLRRYYHHHHHGEGYAKVLRDIGQLLLERELEPAALVAFAAATFKGNQYLQDSFMALIPEVRSSTEVEVDEKSVVAAAPQVVVAVIVCVSLLVGDVADVPRVVVAA